MKLRALGYCGCAILVLLGSACGNASPTVGPGTTPTPSPSPKASPAQVCGEPVAVHPGGIFLASAAALEATVTVDDRQSPSPTCRQLISRQPATLHIGDRVEFVANGPPRLDPTSSDVVTVTTAPGPADSGPGDGPLVTSHVIVTLTAAHPGSVVVDWVDCSGTAC